MQPVKYVALLILISWSGAAWPHHSQAMFDDAKTMTLSGTVKEFQFTNPHCYIQLLVPVQGTSREWSVELGAPAHLARAGWNPLTLHEGDRLTLVIHPLRDGSNGGHYLTGTRAGGKPIVAAP